MVGMVGGRRGGRGATGEKGVWGCGNVGIGVGEPQLGKCGGGVWRRGGQVLLLDEVSIGMRFRLG